MNLKLIFFVSLFAIGFAMSATAGSVVDTDGDLVPDVFDNCPNHANGPGEAPNNQVNTDGDAHGNRCDGDFNNMDPTVDVTDFNLFLADFLNPAHSQFDLDADGSTGVNDFNIFLTLFLGPPGG